jgi:Phytochelatin synthase
LAGGSVAIPPPLLWGDHADYSHVLSIQDAREYQVPAPLEAWALPVAALYHSNIDYQRNVSVCGPASIVNVLRSLHQPDDQASVLEGTGIATVIGYLPGGVTLDQMAKIANQKAGRKVTVLRDLDLAGFREHLRLANDMSCRYVVISHAARCLARVAGTTRPSRATSSTKTWCSFSTSNEKYGSWLVKSERLYEAMNTPDTGTRKTRGLLLIETPGGGGEMKNGTAKAPFFLRRTQLLRGADHFL